MDVTNTGYGPQYGQGAQESAPNQPMTEMEQHGAQLADVAGRLHRLATKLESRVNGFLQPPPTPGDPATGKDSAPTPGTLSALRFYRAEIEHAATRIDKGLDTLAGII